MEKYFDNYFDMVYFINIPKRVDRYNNVMNMFEILNITKYKKIDAVEVIETSGQTNKISVSSQSCTLSHMSCIQDAIDNNYNQICIFEDDFCFNQDDPKIQENLTEHLNYCFNFLKNNDWDIFYFDNIISFTKINQMIVKINRFNNIPFIGQIKRKRHTHSYALSKPMFQRLLDLQKSNNERNDINLGNIVSDKKYVYFKGIFDQLLNEKSDNIWN